MTGLHNNLKAGEVINGTGYQCPGCGRDDSFEVDLLEEQTCSYDGEHLDLMELHGTCYITFMACTNCSTCIINRSPKEAIDAETNHD